MKEERIKNYWSNFFGIKTNKLTGTGVIVVPHANLKDYNGAWIFKRNNRIIISVQPEIVNYIKDKIANLNPKSEDMFSKSIIDYLFGENIQKIIGPTFQGFYDDKVEIQISKKVRKIDFINNQQLIEKLSNSGDDVGWTNSGINKESDGIYGYFHENKIESIANYNIIKGDVGFVGVYTNPKFRGMGFSYEVVKMIVKDLSNKGKLIRYQTLISNKSSVKVAMKIGFKEYAKHLAIRLKME